MKNAHIVIGLGYGDEGKGTITEYLTRREKAGLVVRFNGGSQAAHHVVTDETTHCFAQFGSGTFISGVQTYLSEYMLVDPRTLHGEALVLAEKGVSDALARLSINSKCLVITPFHKTMNRVREFMRGESKHGSCGMGVGETVRDGEILGQNALMMGDLRDAYIMRKKLNVLRKIKVKEAEEFLEDNEDNQTLQALVQELSQPGLVTLLVEEYYLFVKENALNIVDKHEFERHERVVFEGAQGVLLDSEHGFWPYITKTKATFRNACQLIEKNRDTKTKKIGVIRAYHTRHGAGPLITEDSFLADVVPEMHNGKNVWQDSFRVGWFDLVATRYSLKNVEDIDEVALTNLDRLNGIGNVKVCVAYSYEGDKTVALDKYFVYRIQDDKVIIEDIKVLPMPNLAHQSQLACLLLECRPMFVSFGSIEGDLKDPLTYKEYVQWLQKELKIKISILSMGQKYQDKAEVVL